MDVDVFDPDRGSPRVFAIETGAQKIIGLFDGSGDWGSGGAAADWTRQALSGRWNSAPPRSTTEVAETLREHLAQIPSSLPDPEFGMSFSAVVLLCGPDTVSAVCSGSYALRSVRHGTTHLLFRPRLLSDDLVVRGQMTPAEVEAFPHRNVCVGPFLGVSSELTSIEERMHPGDRLVVSHYLRESNTFAAALPGATSALQVAAAMADGAFRSPAVVATWP